VALGLRTIALDASLEFDNTVATVVATRLRLAFGSVAVVYSASSSGDLILASPRVAAEVGVASVSDNSCGRIAFLISTILNKAISTGKVTVERSGVSGTSGGSGSSSLSGQGREVLEEVSGNNRGTGRARSEVDEPNNFVISIRRVNIGCSNDGSTSIKNTSISHNSSGRALDKSSNAKVLREAEVSSDSKRLGSVVADMVSLGVKRNVEELRRWLSSGNGFSPANSEEFANISSGG